VRVNYFNEFIIIIIALGSYDAQVRTPCGAAFRTT